MPLNSLLPGKQGKWGEQVIYAWESDTTAGKAPVSVWFDAACISMASYHTEVNNPAAVGAAICNTSLSYRRVLINASAITKKVKTPQM